MKYQLTLIPLLICLFHTEPVFNQDTTITWIDHSGKHVNKAAATMYRQSWEENELWMVRDFYLDGQLQMTGAYRRPQFKINHGTFIYYSKYNVKTLEVNYDNDYLTGQATAYFDNGTLSETGMYMEGLSFEERNDLIAALPKELPYTRDSTNLKTGTWEYYHINGKLSGREVYKDGFIIYSEYWNDDGSEFDQRHRVHRPAEFPGGKAALAEYLHKRVRLPDTDQFHKVSGTVKIRITIDEKGQVKDPTIIKSVSPTADAHCLEIVKNMPLWIPARMHNRHVKMNYVLPFHFVQPGSRN